jgi:hypothetical protein
MSKYQKLASHLSSLKRDEWQASFEDIESVLGFSLPRSAYSYAAWWSNQQGEGHTQSLAWKSAGWRTGELDLGKKSIVFSRQAHSGKSTGGSTSPKAGITIAEAKVGLAAFYGISPDNIEITIRG